MLTQVKAAAVAGVCAVMLTASCGIEAQDSPALYSTLTIEVKPGTNGQLEEFVGKFRAAAEQTNSSLRWLASMSESGNEVYTFNRPFGSWSEFADAGPQLVEVYGQDEANRLLGLLQASAASMSTSIYVDRPDLSRPGPAADAPPEAVLFIDIGVRLGMEQQFQEYVGKLVEATNATAPTAYWLMRQRLYGPGNVNNYRVIVVLPKWTDLDTPAKPIPQRIREHFPAAEAERLEALSRDSVQFVNQRLNRVRTDLARPPVAD